MRGDFRLVPLSPEIIPTVDLNRDAEALEPLARGDEEAPGPGLPLPGLRE